MDLLETARKTIEAYNSHPWWTVGCRPHSDLPGYVHDHVIAPPGVRPCIDPPVDDWRFRLVSEDPHRCPFADCGEKF